MKRSFITLQRTQYTIRQTHFIWKNNISKEKIPKIEFLGLLSTIIIFIAFDIYYFFYYYYYFALVLQYLYEKWEPKQ